MQCSAALYSGISYFNALHCIILHYNVLHYTRQECIHLPHNPLHPHPPPVRPLTNHRIRRMERNVEYSTEGLFLGVVSSHLLIEFLHKTSQTPPCKWFYIIVIAMIMIKMLIMIIIMITIIVTRTSQILPWGTIIIIVFVKMRMVIIIRVVTIMSNITIIYITSQTPP